MTTTSKPVDEKPELDREALREEAWEQLVGYRADAVSLMQRFGKGSRLWVEKDWQWETPDWDADPESWPPIAKLLYLFARIDALKDRAAFGRQMTKPSYCPDCGPRPTTAHGTWHCPAHTDWATFVKISSAAFFAEAAP